jgi:phage tail sheath protein FI
LKNFGFVIFANKTAYQKTTGAFNNINVRDLLITIENDIEDILIRYVGTFNDATNRLEIKSIVESYLERVKNAGGIYDYMVVMDSTNNTPEIIDQSFGIIDIGIEPVRGMAKIVNRITILKTGAISSGGFSVA